MTYTFKSPTLINLDKNGQIVLSAFEGDNEIAIVDTRDTPFHYFGTFALFVVNHGGDECFLRGEGFATLKEAFDEMHSFLEIEYLGA